MTAEHEDQAEADAREMLHSAVLRALAAGGAGREWQDIGRDVLSGDATLREAGLASVYQDLLDAAANRLHEHREGLDPDEAEAERRTAAAAFAALLEHVRRLRRQERAD